MLLQDIDRSAGEGQDARSAQTGASSGTKETVTRAWLSPLAVLLATTAACGLARAAVRPPTTRRRKLTTISAAMAVGQRGHEAWNRYRMGDTSRPAHGAPDFRNVEEPGAVASSLGAAPMVPSSVAVEAARSMEVRSRVCVALSRSRSPIVRAPNATACWSISKTPAPRAAMTSAYVGRGVCATVQSSVDPACPSSRSSGNDAERRSRPPPP